ncbi:ABC transporter substrate-binding protein [Candidatus Pantoea edessiphila]|uniref:ABC transporter substrate-binding protein n=1 Tax=Candidatus Pantoea edessiphila TaxID=2044610 RepID=A0A2P5T197_9GAMM|nr:ABC transporter substrate-binding protein [Candidatus Pantoea edessiphila]PPI88357.1 ABC transporter substrate-binding protein [Candidatus Pantoea edessiphila]
MCINLNRKKSTIVINYFDKYRILLKFISFVFIVISINTQAKTLVYCSEGSPEGFNPQLFTSNTTYDASSIPIYNRLVEFKKGTIEIEPGLAESWNISPNGKVYTFNLRKGVKWQSSKYFKPTREFNADDVIFTFERQLNKNNKYYKVSGGDYKYFNNMGMTQLINKLEKVDDNTVRFFLSRPYAPFISNLAMDFASILSKEYAENLLKKGNPEKIDIDPIGTGPFQLLSYKKDSMIVYQTNPNYWGTKPKIDYLMFSITPDASIRYSKLKKGECHIVSNPSLSDFENIKKDKDIKIIKQIGANVSFISFNTEKKPFNNLAVRKSLSMAINRKAILNSVYKGNGQISDSLIPPIMWSYNKSTNNYKYDIIEAKKMLKKSGLKDGFSVNLWVMPMQHPYNLNTHYMAEMIKADWAKIGVKTKIFDYKWDEYVKRAQSGEHQAIINGWISDNGDPDNFYSTLFNCNSLKYGRNYSRWCYKPYDEKINLARNENSQKKRIDCYKNAQAMINNQVPALIIIHSNLWEPVNKNIIGYLIDPLGKHHFDTVDMKD